MQDKLLARVAWPRSVIGPAPVSHSPSECVSAGRTNAQTTQNKWFVHLCQGRTMARASTEAPSEIRQSIMRPLSAPLARCSGVLPFRARMSALQPAPTSWRQASSFPYNAARCSAVLPHCAGAQHGSSSWQRSSDPSLTHWHRKRPGRNTVVLTLHWKGARWGT